MGAMTEIVGLEDAGEFFAPASTDMIDGLVGQYRAMRSRIEQVAALVTGETAGAISYFLDGNSSPDRSAPSVDRLFQVGGAVKALDSAYWSKALQLTDVLNYMPQARRDAWNRQLTAWRDSRYEEGKKPEDDLPPFEEETVRSTLLALLNMRSQFLAERVDGIFRGLSGEHVTNSPAAFGKRMIVGYVLNDYWSANHGKCGLINDLRCVIAKFMGRDEPGYSASEGLINTLKGRWGEWVSVDGGALRIRLYKKGTAHIEVHPDMAWRLNMVLSHIYPMAIPPEFRQKPKRKPKEVELIQRPLPFAVINVLASLKQATRAIKQEGNWRQPYRHENVQNALKYDHYGQVDKHVIAEARGVLESIGGVWASEGWWQFDYHPGDVIAEIVASGCVPDKKAHQFYPTPASLAQRAVDLAEIGLDHECLEPSAGTGSLADLMPTERTTCVEISGLHHKVLEAKGHRVIWNDFLPWASGRAAEGKTFDRVVMNPPFDRGQWQSHVEHAAGLLGQEGRLVAILPSGARNSFTLPGFSLQWHGSFDNQFPGASVSVVILVAERQP